MQLEALRSGFTCPRCGRTVRYVSDGEPATATQWLLIAAAHAPPHAAVPIPIGAPLVLGRGNGAWLKLDDPALIDKHAELVLRPDRVLTVRSFDSPAGTWINRAKVLTGVLGPSDTLRVGPFRINLQTTGELTATAGAPRAASAPVETEEEDVVELEPAHDEDLVLGRETTDYTWRDRWAELDVGPRVWLMVCVLVLGFGVYGIARFVLTRFGTSGDMPSETEYRCPVDGTQFRAAWSEEPARCPQCGAACYGLLEVKVEPTSAAQPAPRPAPPTTMTRPIGEGGP